jgi:hypothetical protein
MEETMGREIRRVPPNWEHPRYTEEECRYTSEKQAGRFKPLYDASYKEACQEWKKAFAAWEAGERPDYISDEFRNDEYWDYNSPPPDIESFRPEFTEEPTWYQVYETVTEGTPCSPPFATEEELIDYLVENGDFSYQRDIEKNGHNAWRTKPSRESATAFVKSGWVPSMVVTTGPEGVNIKEGIHTAS